MRTRRGFTLVETLIAVAVVAVLLAIAIPSLRYAIRQSNVTIDLANLRSTHQQFYQWGVEHQDAFVNQGPPEPGRGFVLRPQNSDVQVAGPYSMQTFYWPLVLGGWLGEGYETWHPRAAPKPSEEEANHISRGLHFPGARHAYPSKFEMSLAMLFDPAFFTPGCDTRPTRGMLRFVRWSETAFPASKALLFCTTVDPQNTYVPNPTPFDPVAAMVDGSAKPVDPGSAVVYPGEPCMSEPFSETPLGILGRDLP